MTWTQSSTKPSNVKRLVTKGRQYSGTKRSPDRKPVGPVNQKGNGPGSKIEAEGPPITNPGKQAGPEINPTRSGRTQSVQRTKVHQRKSPNRAIKIINNMLKTTKDYPENKWIR